MVNELNIEIAETEYFEVLLNQSIDYEEFEIGNLERICVEILKEYVDQTLYHLIVELGYNLETTKKVGRFLMEKDFIKEFRDFPIKESI
ncbi:MAG: hypothetical protein ACW98A_17265 [Candidatus Hodarchaeales archaeon]|jgi:hypothetical protein